ncbi:MAG: hypothetical protein V4615_06995 [Bacteroidota bacterium]
MEKKKYEWRMQSLAKGVDPDEAVLELERIEKEFGGLTPENILKASCTKNAVLHPLFNWNDEEAANAFRLQQARNILNNVNITVVSDGEERLIPVYEVVTTNEGRAYKHVDKFTPDDVAQVKAQAVREINHWRQKLSLYTEFQKATKKLDQAVDLLK